ncbi:MAG TPA: glutamyl-tRNA reductase [Candidatus Limnocylindria bacterium]
MDAAGQRLALLHLHQRAAALDARERIAAAATAAAGPDCVVLATCHRVELYLVPPDGGDPRAFVGERTGLSPEDLASLELREGSAAVAHLFGMTCGLDSAVRGEAQIAGQVRAAYDAARAQGPVHPLLARVLERALAVARDVRATLPSGGERRSVGSLAVDEALAHLGDPARATVLVVGAGEIGKLAARALGTRIGTLLVANRDPERAASIAAACGGRTVPFDALGPAIGAADAIISAADTRGAVLTADALSARAARRPLVLVDLAVPRSVAEDARTLPGLVYRSVDDLAETGDLPAERLEAIAIRCDDAARAFAAERRERDAARTIGELREQAERLRAAQLERALARLGHLPERDRRVVEALASGLTNALLHQPTLALKADPDRERVARELFGLSGTAVRPR